MLSLQYQSGKTKSASFSSLNKDQDTIDHLNKVLLFMERLPPSVQAIAVHVRVHPTMSVAFAGNSERSVDYSIDISDDSKPLLFALFYTFNLWDKSVFLS